MGNEPDELCRAQCKLALLLAKDSGRGQENDGFRHGVGHANQRTTGTKASAHCLSSFIAAEERLKAGRALVETLNGLGAEVPSQQQ